MSGRMVTKLADAALLALWHYSQLCQHSWRQAFSLMWLIVINSRVTNHLLLYVKEYIYLSSASFNLNIVSVNKNSHPLLFCLGIDKWGCYTNKIANAWTFLRSNCELVLMFEIRFCFVREPKKKKFLQCCKVLALCNADKALPWIKP